jgi:hypothetical protein
VNCKAQLHALRDKKFGEIEESKKSKFLLRNPLKSLKTAKEIFGNTRQKQAFS